MPTASSPPHASVLDGCGVLYLDHIGTSTENLHASLATLLALPGARLVRGPMDNGLHRLRFALVELDRGARHALFQPAPDSPVRDRIAQTAHLCFAVADAAAAVVRAETNGARRVTDLAPDPTFDGRPSAFLAHPHLGLFRLVAAHPFPEGMAVAPPDELGERLADVLTGLFPALTRTGVPHARVGHTAGWDSLAQMRVLMAVERRFDITIPAERTADLTDFASLLHYLHEVCT